MNTLRYADRLKQKRPNTTQNYDYPKEEIKERVIVKDLLPFDNNNNLIAKKKLLKKIDSKNNFEEILKNKKTEPSKLFPKESPKKLFSKKSGSNEYKGPVTNYPTPNKMPPLPIGKDQHKSK